MECKPRPTTGSKGQSWIPPPPSDDASVSTRQMIEKLNDALGQVASPREPWKAISHPKLNPVGKKEAIWSEQPPKLKFSTPIGCMNNPELPLSTREKECEKLIENLRKLCSQPPRVTLSAEEHPKLFQNVIASFSIPKVEQLKDVDSILVPSGAQKTIGHTMIVDRWKLASEQDHGKATEASRLLMSQILKQNMLDSLIVSIEKVLKFPAHCLSSQYTACLLAAQAMWRGCLVRKRDIRFIAFRSSDAYAMFPSETGEESLASPEETVNSQMIQKNNIKMRKLLLQYLKPAFEVLRVAAYSQVGTLHQSLGDNYNSYVESLWKSFALLRNSIITVLGMPIDEFVVKVSVKVAGKGTILSASDGVSVLDVMDEIQNEVRVLSSNESECIRRFLRYRPDGKVTLQDLHRFILGALSNRKIRLCEFIFEQFEMLSNETEDKPSRRELALEKFYRLFSPKESIPSAKIHAIHSKYRDSLSTNQKLFDKLFEKYAPWTPIEERNNFFSACFNPKVDIDNDPDCTAQNLNRFCSLEPLLRLRQLVSGASVEPVVSNAILQCLQSLGWDDERVSTMEMNSLKGIGTGNHSQNLAENGIPFSAWLQLFAELSSSIPESINFEATLLEAMGQQYSKWASYLENRLQANEKVDAAQRLLATLDQFRFEEAEHEKLAMLKRTLEDRSFHRYVAALNESIRKICASLLKLSGVRRTASGLIDELKAKALTTNAGDWTLTSTQFRAVLTRYGIILNHAEYSVLETHFDNTNSGQMSMGSFASKLFARTRRGTRCSEATLEDLYPEYSRRWAKRVLAGVVPESRKDWLPYQSQEHNGRTYWYCPDTMERRWELPKVLSQRGHKRKQKQREWKNNNKVREEIIDSVRGALESALKDASPWKREDHGSEAQLKELMKDTDDLDARFLEIPKRLVRSDSSDEYQELSGLCLAHLKLERIPDCLLPSLKKLIGIWMNHNSLSALPTGISQCTQLQHISLSHNRIKQVSEPLALSSLTYLDLSHNQLCVIESSFADLVNLEELHIGHNKLTTLPMSIGQLRQLHTITAPRNRISNIDHQTFQNVPKLQHLGLGNNALGSGSLPESMGRLGSLQVLDLQHNSLAGVDLPDSVGQLTNLRQLNVSGNRFEAIPPCILQLGNLEQLLMEHNRIVFATVSTTQAWGLKSLKILNLSNNKLRRSPGFASSSAQAQQLVELKLHNNNLLSLPNLGSLESLKVLWAHNNKIETLPEVFPRNLEELKLNYNKIELVTSGLGRLESLRALDLAGNRIAGLPLSTRGLDQLEYLRLEGNPLEPALAAVVKAGFFRSPEEQSFSFILRKLVDGLRGSDMHGRIDRFFGTSIEDAVAQQQLRNKYYHEDVVLERTGASRPPRRSGALSARGKAAPTDESAASASGSWSKTWSEQQLEQYLDRFALSPGKIRAADFRTCVQLIGTLLSKGEVDRLCAQTFELFDPAGTGVVNYRRVIRAITGRSRAVPALAPQQSISSSQLTRSLDGSSGTSTSARSHAVESRLHAKYAAVAYAVRRYYMAQYNRKIGGKPGGESPREKPEGTRTVEQLREQRDERRKANKALRRELAEARKKAAAVEEVVKAERRQVVPQRPRDEAPVKQRQDRSEAAEKKKLRAALREEVKLGKKLEKEILQHAPAVKDYERLAGNFEGKADPFYCPRPPSRFASKAEEATRLVALPGALETIRKVFNRFGTWTPTLEMNQDAVEDGALAIEMEGGDENSAWNSSPRRKEEGQFLLTKGSMIPAMGEIFKKFGTGRQGMHPEEWRAKLLHSVKEAFEGGYSDSTGNQIAFVSDVQGRMTFKEFANYLKHCHKALLAQTPRNQAAGKSSTPRTTASGPVHDNDSCFGDYDEGAQGGKEVMQSYIAVELLDKSGTVRIPINSLGDTVAHLKGLVQFNMGIPAHLQVMVVGGRRLVDEDSLRASGLSNGGTVRLVVSKATRFS